AGLAQAVAGAQASKAPPLVAVPRDGPLPLSYAQQRLWFLWNLQRDSTAYHIAGGLKLTGELDVGAVRTAMGDVSQQQESLRTTFGTGEDGTARQMIHAQLPYDWRYVDLSGDGDGEASAKAWARGLAHEVFDLEAGPLLRVGVAKLGACEHVLVVSMHHIVSDGWSMNVLLEGFVSAYRARVSGEASGLPALAVQYADYAVWQRQWLEAGERERQLAYWREQLGDEQPLLALPVDRQRQTLGNYSAAHHEIPLPAQVGEALRQTARRLGATPFVVLLAAFHAVLHRHTGQEDIRIGVPVGNRERTEVEALIGFFVNTQVLRAQLNGRTTLAGLLEQIRERARGAQAHPDLPFDVLVDELQPERSLSHTPLFQVVFNHQRLDYGVLAQLPGLGVASYGTGEGGAQFELTLNTTEDSQGRLWAQFTYARELFEERTVERLGRHYVAMLEALTGDGKRTVSDVELLDGAEQAKLLSWARNDEVYEDVRPVHERIAAQAHSTPDATAVVFGNEQVSYAQLEARSNGLAQHLVRLGVGPEVRVGIAAERSVEMVTGLLAILKAGGAYVPLDPGYPAERLAYMMEDSG
ncbi:condensation domain-containing protein, partial [Paraburkholderia sp. BCC1885]|uniref:condensation domain-containing protein n=1 Tax=Paraburkholderia sp. BCC1885 TaxID=2562669 RepID=UPI001183D4B1